MMALFTVGRVAIPLVTVLLSLGLVLSLAVVYLEGKRRFHNGGAALDVGIWTVMGGLAGGWVGYLLIDWNAIDKGWGLVSGIRSGQMAFSGAFLGGLLVIGLFALSRRRADESVSFWELADALTPGLALGVGAVWIASLALGLRFGYALLPDVYSAEVTLNSMWFTHFETELPPFALQGPGIALAAALSLTFWLLRKRWPFPGAACFTFALFYFAGQFFLESIAGMVLSDNPLYVGPWLLAQSFPWRMDHILTLGLVLLAAVGLLVLWRQTRGRVVETPAKTTAPLVIPLMTSLVMAGIIAMSVISIQARPGGSLDKVLFPETAYSNVPRLSLEEAKTRMEKGQAVLVDVRSPESYAEAHAAGAISMPESEISKRLGELPRDQEIILYCA